MRRQTLSGASSGAYIIHVIPSRNYTSCKTNTHPIKSMDYFLLVYLPLAQI